MHAPFWFGAAAVAVGVVIVAAGSRVVDRALHGEPELAPVREAQAVAVGAMD